jgi:hypothetical protein
MAGHGAARHPSGTRSFDASGRDLFPEILFPDNSLRTNIDTLVLL